jgi:adenylate kinase
MNCELTRMGTRAAICLGGIPGVGKTTLLRAHVEMETRDRHVTGSSIVKSLIAPFSVRDLDAWTSGRRDAVRARSIDALRELRMQCPGRLLVDGHFTLRNRSTGQVEPIFTREDCSFFQALVLINAAPHSVLALRAADERGRDVESFDAVAEHIELERQEGRRLANAMSVPLLEIDTADLQLRLRRLADFLEVVSPFAPLS